MSLPSSCAFSGHFSEGHFGEGQVAIATGLELEASMMKFTTLFMQNSIHPHAFSLTLKQHRYRQYF